jgi:hypothetical protein
MFYNIKEATENLLPQSIFEDIMKGSAFVTVLAVLVVLFDSGDCGGNDGKLSSIKHEHLNRN